MSGNRNIESLQAGRGIAATAVVLHHASLAARDFGTSFPGEALLHSGYLGVDFFFVLSGFIIYHSTVGRGKSARSYSKSRLGRILPPYLPVGIGIALLYIWLPGLSAGDRTWDWLPTLTLFPVGTPALSVAWTLQHELLFYVAFGLLYFTGSLRVGMIVWAAAILLWALVGTADVIPLRPLNLEFLFGILAAKAVRSGFAPRIFFLFSALALSIWLLGGAMREQSVLVGLSIAFLIPAVVRAEWDGRISVPRPLVFLGAASYSIYLVHSPAISIVARLLPPSWAILLAGGAIAGLACGIAYHLAVERPLLAMWNQRIPGDRVPVSAD